MSTKAISEHEIKKTIIRIFGEADSDRLQNQVTAFCEGVLNDDDDGDLGEIQLDREWVAHVLPQYKIWLDQLRVQEQNYQQKISMFLTHCLKLNIPGLVSQDLNIQIDRTWIAITEYFESVMPEDLLDVSETDFFIDIQSKTGWWIADSDEPGVDLPLMLKECLTTAGEFSSDLANSLEPVFLKTLFYGTAPLPGFRFQKVQDNVVIWKWLSTEEEMKSVIDDKVIDEALILSSEYISNVFQPLVLGFSPLSENSLREFSTLISGVDQLQIPGKRDLLREVGVNLGIRAIQASQKVDSEQLKMTNYALSKLTPLIERTEESITGE